MRGDCLATSLIMLGFMDLGWPRVCRRPTSVLFLYCRLGWYFMPPDTTRVGGIDGICFTQRLWALYSNLAKYMLLFTWPIIIRPGHTSAHAMTAAMVLANLWPDKIIKFGIRATRIVTRFELLTRKCFVKWTLGSSRRRWEYVVT